MRVAIVNDLRMAAEALRRAVTSDPAHSIAWIASNGDEAVRFSQQDPPDVVLMDLVMPEMNGAQATRHIMQLCPCPVLIVTADVTRNFSLVCEAMGYGAYDAACLPVIGDAPPAAATAELLRKLQKVELIRRHLTSAAAVAPTSNVGPAAISDRDSATVSRAELERAIQANDPPAAVVRRPPVPPDSPAPFGLIAIGASTGGPQALDAILSRCPADLQAAVVVAQHIGHDFADSLAQWLGSRSRLRVRIAHVGDVLQSATVYLAATKDHMVMRRDRTLAYSREPIDVPYRPSVNVLFSSLAVCWPWPAIAVLLTGIGKDGAEGLLELRRSGWHTVAQDEKSSVVFGMPQAATKLGAALRILPIDEIADHLVTRVRSAAKR